MSDQEQGIHVHLDPQGNDSPKLIGGPLDGDKLKHSLRKAWTVTVYDPLRKRHHTYERLTPTDPAYYFKRTESPPPSTRDFLNR